MKLTIGEPVLTATLADNSSVKALEEKLKDGPIAIQMEDYARMEKVGNLPFHLPTNDQPITTKAGDLILYLCAVDMKEKGALIGNTAVATVASNLGVEKALNREGIRMERTPVGDKYVSARMQEGGYSIGGEESGHIIFSKYSTTGDGILTAIRVMEILVEKKTLPSFLTAGVQLFPKVQINKRVKDASAVLEREAVKQAVRQAEEELGETGRVLIRKSGTEPVIRLIVEADEEEKCRRLAERIAAEMEE